MTEQGDLEQAALIFERARELEGEARRAYLDEACNGNATLRAEILSMLAAYEDERSMRGADHKYAKRCADSLTDLYERWGKPDQIEAWRVAGSKIAPDSP